jgi:hypothetical protein
MLAENENTKELVAREFKLDSRFLDALERIGLGQLEPKLLLESGPAARRAVQFCMPIAQQRQILDGYITVVTPDNGHGGTRVIQKRLDEITAIEAPRVISEEGKVRTPDEQSQVLIQQAQRKAARSLRYEIEGDKITFHARTTLTWSELQELADKIKPSAKDLQKAMNQNTLTH